MADVQILDWHGVYSDGWKGIITDASFAHPAKMARGQLRRILWWLLSEGRIRPGQTVIDPFGGIGSTGIECAYVGLQAVLCELEPKFHALALENFELHRRHWEVLGATVPQIVNGDSRKLSELLAPVLAECCVSSPPYAESINNQSVKSCVKSEAQRGMYNLGGGQLANPGNYGQTPGQLGAMKAGDVAAVLSSLPYASGTVHDGNGIDQSKLTGNPAGEHSQAKAEGYGQTLGQLGSMPTGDCVVSSPPYEGSVQGTDVAFFEKMEKDQNPGPRIVGRRTPPQDYGESDGQLGREQAETFWAAAAEIVHQCWLLLKPGATTCWVTKAFVRNGAIVDFPGDWSRLLESQGFRVTHHIRCWLTSETKEDNLFGGVDVKKTSRKSFFRRLHEKKRPDLAIDYEVVVVAEKTA